jgi:DNA-binding IscR family transcriptional regulator
MNKHPLPQQKVEAAERKVSAVLEELEEAIDADVKKISLEDVVDTDATSGQPAVHQAVDITVAPRARRKWLK